MNMKRGFTIAELVVVVTVLTILIGLSTFGGSIMMDRARQSQRSSMASIIFAAAEKYYKLNNEYPSAYELGGLATALPPSNYSLASQKLDLPVDKFKAGSAVFTPCGFGANCSSGYLDKDRVYYATRYRQTDTGTIDRVIIPINSSGAECK
jgi:prepilin-type N-terminal cleavage/methylation domain-containing protein